MDPVKEFLALIPEESRKAMLAQDPELVKRGTHMILIKIHLVPPSQLRSMIKVDSETGEVGFREDLSSDDGFMEDLLWQYCKFLDARSREEMALLGWQRLIDTIRLQDPGYKRKDS